MSVELAVLLQRALDPEFRVVTEYRAMSRRSRLVHLSRLRTSSINLAQAHADALPMLLRRVLDGINAGAPVGIDVDHLVCMLERSTLSTADVRAVVAAVRHAMDQMVPSVVPDDLMGVVARVITGPGDSPVADAIYVLRVLLEALNECKVANQNIVMGRTRLGPAELVEHLRPMMASMDKGVRREARDALPGLVERACAGPAGDAGEAAAASALPGAVDLLTPLVRELELASAAVVWGSTLHASVRSGPAAAAQLVRDMQVALCDMYGVRRVEPQPEAIEDAARERLLVDDELRRLRATPRRLGPAHVRETLLAIVDGATEARLAPVATVFYRRTAEAAAAGAVPPGAVLTYHWRQAVDRLNRAVDILRAALD
jgi:hypothetical protein